MNKILLITFLTVFPFMNNAQTRLNLTVGEKSVTATLIDNEATRTLEGLLANGPITIEMSDYGGFEKVGALPQSLPTSNSQINTTPGDIMLYQGKQMVIFYGTNSWSYTRLGRIDDEYLSELQEFLGKGNISLTITLDKSSGIKNITSDNLMDGNPRIFDLRGNLITRRPLTPGIYIINNRKTLIQ